MTNQEMRKGSSKLLKTLMMRLSLVTESICGPGNCPFINIPCISIQNSFYQHQKFPQQRERERESNDKVTCCLTPRGQISPQVTFQLQNLQGSSPLVQITVSRATNITQALLYPPISLSLTNPIFLYGCLTEINGEMGI